MIFKIKYLCSSVKSVDKKMTFGVFDGKSIVL